MAYYDYTRGLGGTRKAPDHVVNEARESSTTGPRMKTVPEEVKRVAKARARTAGQRVSGPGVRVGEAYGPENTAEQMKREFFRKRAEQFGAQEAATGPKTPEQLAAEQQARAKPGFMEGFKSEQQAALEKKAARRARLKSGLKAGLKKGAELVAGPEARSFYGRLISKGLRYATSPLVVVPDILFGDPTELANGELSPEEFKRLNAKNIAAEEAAKAAQNHSQPAQPTAKQPTVTQPAAKQPAPAGEQNILTRVPGTPDNPALKYLDNGATQEAYAGPNNELVSTIHEKGGGYGEFRIPGGLRDEQGNIVSPQDFLNRGNVSSTGGTVQVQMPDGTVRNVSPSVALHMRTSNAGGFLSPQGGAQDSRRNYFLNLLQNARTLGDVKKAQAGLAALTDAERVAATATKGDSGKAALNAAKTAKYEAEAKRIMDELRTKHTAKSYTQTWKQMQDLITKGMKDGTDTAIFDSMYGDLGLDDSDYNLLREIYTSGQVLTQEQIRNMLRQRHQEG